MSELPTRGLNATKNDDVSCRYCWRPIFISGYAENLGKWILIYREYEDTSVCDARGDGAVLSTLPHEPAPAYAVTIPRLIELAAQFISEPGDFRDTAMERDWATVRLITEAAGLTAEDEKYVFAAVMRAAYENRGKDFQAKAWRYRATEPWDEYWQSCQTVRAGGRPSARANIHKASPGGPGSWDERENVANCARCGQRIKLVPGGQGMTWVHADSGAVAAPNPPAQS